MRDRATSVVAISFVEEEHRAAPPDDGALDQRVNHLRTLRRLETAEPLQLGDGQAEARHLAKFRADTGSELIERDGCRHSVPPPPLARAMPSVMARGRVQISATRDRHTVPSWHACDRPVCCSRHTRHAGSVSTITRPGYGLGTIVESFCR